MWLWYTVCERVYILLRNILANFCLVWFFSFVFCGKLRSVFWGFLSLKCCCWFSGDEGKLRWRKGKYAFIGREWKMLVSDSKVWWCIESFRHRCFKASISPVKLIFFHSCGGLKQLISLWYPEVILWGVEGIHSSIQLLADCLPEKIMIMARYLS